MNANFNIKSPYGDTIVCNHCGKEQSFTWANKCRYCTKEFDGAAVIDRRASTTFNPVRYRIYRTKKGVLILPAVSLET